MKYLSILFLILLFSCDKEEFKSDEYITCRLNIGNHISIDEGEMEGGAAISDGDFLAIQIFEKSYYGTFAVAGGLFNSLEDINKLRIRLKKQSTYIIEATLLDKNSPDIICNDGVYSLAFCPGPTNSVALTDPSDFQGSDCPRFPYLSNIDKPGFRGFLTRGKRYYYKGTYKYDGISEEIAIKLKCYSFALKFDLPGLTDKVENLKFLVMRGNIQHDDSWFETYDPQKIYYFNYPANLDEIESHYDGQFRIFAKYTSNGIESRDYMCGYTDLKEVLSINQVHVQVNGVFRYREQYINVKNDGRDATISDDLAYINDVETDPIAIGMNITYEGPDVSFIKLLPYNSSHFKFNFSILQNKYNSKEKATPVTIKVHRNGLIYKSTFYFYTTY